MLSVIVIASFFIFAEAGMMRESANAPLPHYYCYSTVFDSVFMTFPGKTISVPNFCMKARCEEDRTISYYGCGKEIKISEDVKTCQQMVRDLSKPYPQCCPYTICPRK